MGTILKKGSKNSVFIDLARFDYILYFYFYASEQNKCVHVLHCDIIRIKEDCCWLIFFFKLSTQFNLFLYSINHQPLPAKK